MDPDRAPVANVRFSPNGKLILVSSLDRKIRLWRYELNQARVRAGVRMRASIAIRVCAVAVLQNIQRRPHV